MTSQNTRPTTSKSSILDLLSPKTLEQIQTAYGVVRDQKAASDKRFNDRQHELALSAPVLHTSREEGGVDKYARELTIQLIDNWSVAVKTEAGTRFVNAKAALVNTLFEAHKAAALAAGFSEEEAIVKARDKVKAADGVLKIADRSAHKAVDYAFGVIDEENKAKKAAKAPANAS